MKSSSPPAPDTRHTTLDTRPRFSVVIPAHNEEELLPVCLNSIDVAAAHYPQQVEIVVVVNRCTDATESIARERSCRIVHDNNKNLAMIRNAGVKQAAGEIVLTVDADSRMAANTFEEIDKALASGRFIGGGVPIRPERMSAGIMLTGLLLAAWLVPSGISGGLFWCYRRDFGEIGGFNEQLTTAEDVEFGKRLKARGRAHGKKYGTLWKAPIVTSCRKFDTFGDWFAVRLFCLHPIQTWKTLHGRHPDMGNRYWYDVPRRRVYCDKKEGIP